MKAYKTSVPIDSIAFKYVAQCDYTDAFAVDLLTPATLTADDIQISFWTDMPRWVGQMMKLRNVLVRPFGLKGDKISLDEVRLAIATGASTGVMSVVEKSESETVILLDDKHLSTYMSVIADPQRVTVATIVNFKNRFGRLYFTIIKPFHKIIAKHTLKRAVKVGIIQKNVLNQR